MSGLGQERTLSALGFMSSFGGIADVVHTTQAGHGCFDKRSSRQGFGRRAVARRLRPNLSFTRR